MNHAPIYISRDDHSKLRLLLNTALYSSKGNIALKKLREELDRAVIIDPHAIPAGLITIDSCVEYEDIGSGEIEEYTLTYPDRAKVEEKRLSILAPVGTALIGYREGDIVSWITPGGIRSLKIRKVTHPGVTTLPPVREAPVYSL